MVDRASGDVIAGFEVERSTSIYSGIVRLLDLALGCSGQATHNVFLVAPDDAELRKLAREHERLAGSLQQPR